MRLKSITLDGFKSYSDRVTVRAFDPLFTAITGSNGAGKSNIVDAILFALDLVPPSRLRVLALSELINNHRSSCTVTVVFDNRPLPSDSAAALGEPSSSHCHRTDFQSAPFAHHHYFFDDELTIERSFDRSGKSRVKLNGHACTLAALSSFCRSMGISERSIVCQGQITRIVAMKGRELRSLIEETAGTAGLEQESERACAVLVGQERRLREAKQRLQLSISPFVSRLVSARAKTAGKKIRSLREIAREQLSVRRQLALAEAAGTAAELEEALGEFQRLSTRLGEIREVEEAEENAAESEKRILSAGEAVSLKTRISELQAFLEAAEKEKEGQVEISDYALPLTASYTENTTDDNLTNETLTNETLTNTKLTIGCSSGDDLSISIISKRVLSETLERRRQLEEKQAVIEQQLCGVSTLDRIEDLERTRDEATRLLAKLEGVDSVLTSDRLRSILPAGLGELIRDLDSKTNRLLGDYVNYTDELSQLSKCFVDFFDDDHKVCTSDIIFAADLPGVCSEAAQHSFSATSLLDVGNKAVRCYEILHSLASSMASEAARARAQLGFAAIDGVFGTLAENMCVSDRRYAVALSVVLGARASFVLVADDAVAAQLIGSCNRRISVIPLNKISTSSAASGKSLCSSSELAKMNAVRAIDVIEFDQKFRAAFEFVFANVFLFETKEDASKCCAALRGYCPAKCVALDGTLYDTRGTVTGGFSSSSSSQTDLFSFSTRGGDDSGDGSGPGGLSKHSSDRCSFKRLQMLEKALGAIERAVAAAPGMLSLLPHTDNSTSSAKRSDYSSSERHSSRSERMITRDYHDDDGVSLKGEGNRVAFRRAEAESWVRRAKAEAELKIKYIRAKSRVEFLETLCKIDSEAELREQLEEVKKELEVTRKTLREQEKKRQAAEATLAADLANKERIRSIKREISECEERLALSERAEKDKHELRHLLQLLRAERGEIARKQAALSERIRGMYESLEEKCIKRRREPRTARSGKGHRTRLAAREGAKDDGEESSDEEALLELSGDEKSSDENDDQSEYHHRSENTRNIAGEELPMAKDRDSAKNKSRLLGEQQERSDVKPEKIGGELGRKCAKMFQAFSKYKLPEKEQSSLRIRLSELRAEEAAARTCCDVDTKHFELLDMHLQAMKELETKISILERDRERIAASMERLIRLGEEANRAAFRAVNSSVGKFFSYFVPNSDVAIDSDSFEIRVKIGGRENTLSELSGGQRSLVALSLIFSMLRYSPAALYVFDEIDAALDMNYAQAIGEIIRSEFGCSQFIVVSLRSSLYEAANRVLRVQLQDQRPTVTVLR